MLTESVIVNFLYDFSPLIGIFIFPKNIMRILAQVLENVELNHDASDDIAMRFIVMLVAFLPDPLLIAYVVRIARERFLGTLFAL